MAFVPFNRKPLQFPLTNMAIMNVFKVGIQLIVAYVTLINNIETAITGW